MFGCEKVSRDGVEGEAHADCVRKGRVYIVCSKNPKHKQVSPATVYSLNIIDSIASRIDDQAE
jgi:hypothetical protein